MPKKTVANLENTRFTEIEQCDIVITGLRWVRQMAKKGTLVDPSIGLCYHLWYYLSRTGGMDEPTAEIYSYDLICLIGADWPKSVFPGLKSTVPVPYTPKKWTQRGLELRLDLINYTLLRVASFRQQLRRRSLKEIRS